MSTPAAARAASSHTGVMAKGSDTVFDRALKQAGAIRAQTIEEFFDFAKAFECFTPLKLQGNRIVIAAYPGGEGVIMTDACQLNGLSMADVSPETYDELKAVAPPWTINPNYSTSPPRWNTNGCKSAFMYPKSHQDTKPMEPILTLDPRCVYTDAHLLSLLNISDDCLRKARRSGELQFNKVGKVYVYKSEWIEAWLFRGT